MADSGPGYYNGAPAAMHVKHKAPTSEPVDEVPIPGHYAGGRPKKPAAGGGKDSAAPTSGFFASCCACFSGGGTAK